MGALIGGRYVKALMLMAPREVKIVEVDEPAIEDLEVLVKVYACGFVIQ